jgi:EpsI family protein
MHKASRLALVLFTFCVGFSLHRAIAQGDAQKPAPKLQQLPLVVGSWHSRDEELPQDVLLALRVDDYLYRRYQQKAGDPVTLYVAYYGRQRLDERIHSPRGCLPAGGWFPVSAGYQEIVIPGTPSHHFTANHYLVEKGLDRQVVLYWFQGRGRIVADEIKASLLLAFDTLSGRGSDEMLVRVNAPVRESPGHTLADELRLVQLLFPRLAGFEAGS